MSQGVMRTGEILMVKTGIKKQTLTLLLLCILVTLVLVGGIALYGMVNIRSSAVQIGQSIGQSLSLIHI